MQRPESHLKNSGGQVKFPVRQTLAGSSSPLAQSRSPSQNLSVGILLLYFRKERSVQMIVKFTSCMECICGRCIWIGPDCMAPSCRIGDSRQPRPHNRCRHRIATAALCKRSCWDIWHRGRLCCMRLVGSRPRRCCCRPDSRWHHCICSPMVCTWSFYTETPFRHCRLDICNSIHRCCHHTG